MAESKIRDDNYFQISGWMLNRLGLKGTPLQVFSIIYGFSQDNESYFTGSLQYLSDFTNASRPTVIKALKELVEKGYILKYENEMNGVKFNKYRANLLVVKNLYWDSKETLPGGSQVSLPGGSKETLPNNKDSYNKSLIDKEIENVIEAYHSVCGSFSKVVAVSPARKKAIAELLKTYRLGSFQTVFTNAENSSFLKGQNDRGWKANFDWLINEANFIKVLEGNYADRGRKEVVPGWMNKPREMDEDEIAAVKRMLADDDLQERAEKLRQSLQEGV